MSSTTPSTYTRIFGECAFAGWFIEHLGLARKDFGRFRDASLYRDGVCSDGKGIYVIRVITRNAGSRSLFQPVNDRLAQHPLYLRQELDPTDEGKTYLYFFFKMPDSMIRELQELPELPGGKVDLDIAFRNGDTWLVDNRDLKTKFSRVESDKE